MKVFSKKQRDYLINSNYAINVAQGAVSSGKSFVAMIRFLEFVKDGPPGAMVICGKSERTIKQNIIEPLFNFLGNCFVYKEGVGEVNLWNRRIYLVGGNDARSESKLRGATFAGALVDEVTILPEPFYKMLLSRMRVEGAKIFVTTNPDSPHHWFKTDYIDRESELDQKTWHFTLDDNPELPEKYKENIKKLYTGIWYDRFILGLWTVAEGRVYDMFSKEHHVFDNITAPPTEYIVGIDYGTVNPACFLLIGINYSGYPKIWVEQEYYYDSKIHNRQKDDEELVSDLKKFIEYRNVKSIYVDPSAASFKATARRSGIALCDADNDVINGIKKVSVLLSRGDLKISSSCVNLIKEIESYRWDSNSAAKGIEKPIKDADHSVDSVRYALATHFKDLEFKQSMTYEDILKYQNKNQVHPYLLGNEPSHAKRWY